MRSDFRPLNILADHGRLTGVIDWVKATIADPAFDYGAVLAIFATVVLIQNLKPDILMMQPAEDWNRCDAADLLRRPKIRSIFIQ